MFLFCKVSTLRFVYGLSNVAMEGAGVRDQNRGSEMKYEIPEKKERGGGGGRDGMFGILCRRSAFVVFFLPGGMKGE